MEDHDIPLVAFTEEEIKEAMKELRINSIDDLYSDIPSKFFIKGGLNLEGPLSEQEVLDKVSKILSKNATTEDLLLFVGAGVWPHYVPAAVSEVISRSEFLTSYTQYQPEIAQGMLKALFEYQSMMAELVGLDVVNASHYDWATALGEAGRMAYRLTGRKRILVPRYICPDRLEVLEAYVQPLGIKVERYPSLRLSCLVDVEALKEQANEDVAAVYLENPSYLGFIVNNAKAVGEVAHDVGALFIVGVDPTSLGILAPPGYYGADVVVGEGQPLGLGMNFGGPLLGIIACRYDQRLVRTMPGRIIGMTRTMEGYKRAFVMALQAREQHIKREKATSNITTNQALCAVAAAVYLCLLGKKGMRELGENIIAKTSYAIRSFSKIKNVEVPLFDGIHFKEFTYRVKGKDGKYVLKKLLDKKIVGGKYVGEEFEETRHAILSCVTELHSKHDIDFYVKALMDLEGE